MLRRNSPMADLKSEDPSNSIANIVYAWHARTFQWLIVTVLMKPIGPCRFRIICGEKKWRLFRVHDWIPGLRILTDYCKCYLARL